MENPFVKFLSEDQWKKLDLDSLTGEDAEIVLNVFRRAFKGVDPEEADPEDVAAVVSIAQELADDFREKFDAEGFDETELNAGAHASGELLEEMNGD